jgi:hypothetical protein
LSGGSGSGQAAERGNGTGFGGGSRVSGREARLHSRGAVRETRRERFLEAEGWMDANEAVAQLTSREQYGRIEVHVDGHFLRAALVRGNEPIEIQLRTPSLSRSVAQHQLS